MSDGHRSGRSTGRVSCKSTELKRCSMTEMRYCYYYYYKRMPWSQKKLQEHLSTGKVKPTTVSRRLRTGVKTVRDQTSGWRAVSWAVVWRRSIMATNIDSTYYYNHLTASVPGQPGWAGTRKVKAIWILLEQETVSGSLLDHSVARS